SHAGSFGWGSSIRHSQLSLESVDNSYMLFTMRRGFVFLGLFLMVPVVVALRGMKAFAAGKLPTHWIPLAVGIASIIGIMAAMYTVWFGFVYSVLWVIMIGLTTSMSDVLIFGPPTARPASQPQTRGFAPQGFAMTRGA